VARAIWNNTVIAESDKFELVEGNVYFPAESVNSALLRDSDTQTTCHWKGVASYCDIVVNEETNKDAAWYYAEPSAAAQNIKGHIAFWKGVKVEK
jgi:uncharacterized protein (DUF427 family)